MLARKLAGLTIDQAAQAAGVKPSSWSNWEAGRRPQRETDILGMIADALDIDLEWLTYGGRLTSAYGRPTGRSESDTDGYPVSDLGMGFDYDPYPSSAVPSKGATSRPSDLRPKSRQDRSHPMSPSVAGRRATLVR